MALVIDLAPHSGIPGGGATPFKVPVFTVGHVLLRHASIEVLDPGGLGHLKVLDVTLELEGGGPRRLEGAVTVAGGVTLDNDDTRARVDRVEGRAFLDGDTIGVKPASAVVGTQRLALDGSIAFTGPSPRFDLGIAGGVDVAQIASWFPALPAGNGPLQVTGRVTGPLNNPQLRYSARSAGVTLPDIRLPASTAEGYISQAGIYVERLRTGLGKGWVEAAGRLPLGLDDPNSRFSLTWNAVPIASLAQVFPLLPSGPNRDGGHRICPGALAWRGPRVRDRGGRGHVRPAGRAVARGGPGQDDVARPGDGRCAVSRYSMAAPSPASTRPSRLARPTSPNRASLGTLHVVQREPEAGLEEATRAFSGVARRFCSGSIDSPLVLDAAIEGSLGAPRLAGTAASERLRIGVCRR